MKTCKRWTEEDNILFRQIYPTLTQDELLKVFPDRTKVAINIHASLLGLRKSRNPYITTNCQYLLEDTTETFYWAGFILADGNISNNRLKVSISIKDQEHLHKLASRLNINISINNTKSNFGEVRMCQISCMDKKNILAFSDKFQIHNNKTYNPPKDYTFDDYLMLSILIGIIDGDGCIRNQTGRNDCSIRIKCHSSWCSFYTTFHQLLDKYFGSKSRPPKISNSGYMEWAIADYRLVKGLKRFAIDNKLPILTRKWDKIDLSIIPKTEKSRMVDQICMANPNLTIAELAKLAGIGYGAARSSKIRVFDK